MGGLIKSQKGHTVFIERKIIGRMYGQKQLEFQAIGGWTGKR